MFSAFIVRAGDIDMAPAVKQWECRGNTGVLRGDELWFRYRGKLDLEIAQSASEFMKAVSAEGPVFFIADVDGAEPDAGFRKHLADSVPLHAFKGLVLIHAGLVQRIAQKAIAIAAMLSSRVTPPMINVDSEDEARAWIAAQRSGAAKVA